MGVHCVAHRANLVVQSFGGFDLAQIEGFIMNMYVILAIVQNDTWSLKNWFKPWIQKGVCKKNVKTRWMSMLEPLKRTMAKYRHFIIKKRPKCNQLIFDYMQLIVASK